MTRLSVFAALLALCAGVLSHPETPEAIRAAIKTRNLVVAHSKRAMERCNFSPESQALRLRATARRAATAQELRKKRGLENTIQRRGDRESLLKWGAQSHDRTYEGFNPNTPAEILFGSNTTCALVPETIIGPYYVEGELIRTDLTDGQKGVPTHLEFQFIDINTCKPIPHLIIDVWHANATGVYSGVTAKGQGGLDTTFGRGAQKTDYEGVVHFDTIFPGHYAGRPTHYHVMSTAGANLLPNGTFEGGTAQHIGQTYFDESLIRNVESRLPYSLNRQPYTSNADDEWAADEATPEYDPFMKYVYLGNDVSDGLLAWITIAMDPSADYNDKKSVAAHWYPDGGVDHSHRTRRP
ncbi:hypothetical protein HIM_00313 [Hirsutella minnesotensis 3608]|nr:hypothetical protein HIM_00313 [Hirsutella minnesotensis 3608]